MVLGDTLRSRTRHAMHYCYAPALCSDCYRSHGGKHLHDACAEGAAASQAKYDAIEAALDAGESFVIAAYGEWHESVPDGMVGLLFRGRSGEVNRLAKAVDYNRGGDTKLSDIETQPWEV
ncbi:hypothetical protein [Mycobacterium sp. AZCC_0083]|uniref:hypothetical protein n=1 Tax=Mycobacterium sp. AZCC_0083 TaxID=2735882 RepID=UPI001622DDEF|nr:hypothetical protein [Mycobacterium sp. AZCC_0083]MBB5167083.1 hypothetical protein [Mycobacterium sp. AZCC_0083]